MEKSANRTDKYLFFTVFIAGLSTMAVEFGASRLLSNVFGTSNLIWAVIIGLIMVYLTVGYWLGGKLADRYPGRQMIYKALLWSGFVIGLIPSITTPILRFSANAFDELKIAALAGSFAAVIILFTAPVVLLGTITPMAMKLIIQDTQHTGRMAGKISAISTLGSFLGTFLTVLVLIPLIGTYRTFFVISLVLLFVSIIGLVRELRWRSVMPYLLLPIMVIILAILSLKGTVKTTQGLIFETESSYNYIQVLEYDDYRFLRLNEGQGVHSIYHPVELFYAGPWSQVLVAPYFNELNQHLADVNLIAIIGLAAGTTARQANVVYPNAMIDGFEIDAKIVETGKKYFNMSSKNLNVIIEDGRRGIAHSHHFYDIISVDAYRIPYIPEHMTTVEFFQIIKDHLTEKGMMVINVGRSPYDRDLINDLGSTISAVFPTVFVTDIPDSFNSIIFASNDDSASWVNFDNNRENLKGYEGSDLLIKAMDLTLSGRAEQPAYGRIYTDDLTPIFWITNRVVLDFVFSGGLETFE